MQLCLCPQAKLGNSCHRALGTAWQRPLRGQTPEAGCALSAKALYWPAAGTHAGHVPAAAGSSSTAHVQRQPWAPCALSAPQAGKDLTEIQFIPSHYRPLPQYQMEWTAASWQPYNVLCWKLPGKGANECVECGYMNSAAMLLQPHMLLLQEDGIARPAIKMQHGPLRPLLPRRVCGRLPAYQVGPQPSVFQVPSALLCALRPFGGLGGHVAVPQVLLFTLLQDAALSTLECSEYQQGGIQSVFAIKGCVCFLGQCILSAF